MRDLVGFHKPIGMRHKLSLSRGASIHCQQAREIGSQRGQGVFERGQKSGGTYPTSADVGQVGLYA
jgi:hypothetical protein